MARSALSILVLFGLAGCTRPLPPPVPAAGGARATAPVSAGAANATSSGAPSLVTADVKTAGEPVPAVPPAALKTALPSPEQACPATRFVGVRGTGAAACPAAGGAQHGRWAVRELFQPTGAQGKAALPEGLRRFCVYDWRPSERGARPDTVALKAVPGLARLAPDCQAVAALGSHSTDVAWQPVHEAFLRRVDWLPELPRGAEAAKAVRVAVLDTSPDGSNDGRPLEGRSGHGFAVGSIIRELGCPADMPAAPTVAGTLSCAGRCGGQAPGGCWCDDACGGRGDCCGDQPSSCGKPGACIARVTTHLATPHLDETAVDYVRGGYFGTQAELAAALHRALSDWVAHRAEEPHLVINLSLGWDARYGGGPAQGERVVDPAKLTGAVAAVHAMLVRAACLGAIVVAAAGNDPGGPDVPLGPMLPAGWETLPAPTRAQCRGLAESTDSSVPATAEGAYRPLLYSVGGLGANDAALRTGRLGGRPRLAAAATHGVAIRHDGSSARLPTDILSGTSVAAAAVSGIAATVWGYRPSLTPGKVMDAVYRSGTKVDETADYHLAFTTGAPADLAIRRVGLCEALADACAETGGACAGAQGLACKPVPPHTDAGARLTDAQLAELEAWATHVVDGSGVVYSLPPVPVCGPQGHFNDAPQYPDIVCPERQYDGAATRPWTFPQPGADPCPPCEVSNKSIGPVVSAVGTASAVTSAPYRTTLYVAIDSNFGQRLRAVTLDLPGVGQISLPDIGVLVPGSIVVFKDIPVSALPGRGAVLSFAVLDATGQIVGSTASVLLEQDQ